MCSCSRGCGVVKQAALHPGACVGRSCRQKQGPGRRKRPDLSECGCGCVLLYVCSYQHRSTFIKVHLLLSLKFYEHGHMAQYPAMVCVCTHVCTGRPARHSLLGWLKNSSAEESPGARGAVGEPTSPGPQPGPGSAHQARSTSPSISGPHHLGS